MRKKRKSWYTFFKGNYKRGESFLFHPEEDMAALMNKAHHSQVVTIDKTYHLFSAFTLEDVVKALEQAKHVYLFLSVMILDINL